MLNIKMILGILAVVVILGLVAYYSYKMRCETCKPKRTELEKPKSSQKLQGQGPLGAQRPEQKK